MSLLAAQEQALRAMMMHDVYIDDCPLISDSESSSDLADKKHQLDVHESATHKELQADEPETESPFTTVMLRNVPCKIDKERVEEELAKLGFANTYDHIHFPTRRSKSTLGYGFINFMKSGDALAFMAAFDGYTFPGTLSTKRCYVSRANLQGREANLAQFSSQTREVMGRQSLCPMPLLLSTSPVV
eukprot:TRINITY_DN8284_c0_g2_i1.p1 TRINITY_DN8284_c0_g2~~TRINITY_DN8284_c0_g2_i1.p1  ORF type:complete len:187 (-),score=25.17 TRINITY_DN8284_c0_g2_i1:255-815(-)